MEGQQVLRDGSNTIPAGRPVWMGVLIPPGCHSLQSNWSSSSGPRFRPQEFETCPDWGGKSNRCLSPVQRSNSVRLEQAQVLQCSMMRKTSVRELHIHTSELVREASGGGIIVIERRGEPVAELRPISPPRMPAGKKARIFTSMRKVWARMPQVSDSTKMLEEDRSR